MNDEKPIKDLGCGHLTLPDEKQHAYVGHPDDNFRYSLWICDDCKKHYDQFGTYPEPLKEIQWDKE